MSIFKKLSGKVAFVTGASKGIGAAIATHFDAEGASVVANYSSDIANVVFLVGPDTGWGDGQPLRVNGGIV